MNKKLKSYIPIIVGAAIIIVALILILGLGKSDSKKQSLDVVNKGSSDNTVAPAPSNPMPPAAPPEPALPPVDDLSIPATDTQGNAQCTDSDGGLNYTVKGIVTVIKDGSTSKFTDYCRHSSFEGYVVEFSCGDTGVVTTSHKCVKGCNNNGACY